MSALFQRARLLASRSTALCRASSTATPTQLEDTLVPVQEDDEAAERAWKLELSRNKSRLSVSHLNIVHDRRPYEVPICRAHLTVKYNRKLYGKYGAASGVNPSICWPSKRDLADAREYEGVAHPFTIQEMAEQAAKKRQEEKRMIDERQQSIALKLTKLEVWKKDLNDRLNKKMAEVQKAKEKKERLVDEVRRHFGFKLDYRDERFQEMLAKRELEQRKQEKLARREAKEQQMLAKIQQKNVAITENKDPNQ